MTHTMEEGFQGEAKDRLPRGHGRMPSSAGQATDAGFDHLLLDSKHFIQWDPPTKKKTASDGGEEEGAVLVVLLGWLGASQKLLRRYADLYRDRGFGLLRYVYPLSQVMGRHFGRRFERRVAHLSTMIAAWCEADPRRTVLLHTFSYTGWITYGVLLESLQSKADVMERIRGCIVDSAPVLEIRPEVWAAGFSGAIFKKKKSSLRTPHSADCPDGPILNGALSKVNSVPELTKPSWGEAFVLSTLRMFFKILLNIPDVKKRLCKLLAVLSEKQPSCPQFYLYSSADTVIPAEDVESFIRAQISLGLTVSAHNFVPSPHVDHYRSFPRVYAAKLDEFLNICYPAKVCQSKM